MPHPLIFTHAIPLVHKGLQYPTQKRMAIALESVAQSTRESERLQDEIKQILSQPIRTRAAEQTHHAWDALRSGFFEDAIELSSFSIQEYRLSASPYLVRGIAALQMGDAGLGISSLVDAVKYARGEELPVGATAALIASALIEADDPDYSRQLLEAADASNGGVCIEVALALLALNLEDVDLLDRAQYLWWSCDQDHRAQLSGNYQLPLPMIEYISELEIAEQHLIGARDYVRSRFASISSLLRGQVVDMQLRKLLMEVIGTRLPRFSLGLVEVLQEIGPFPSGAVKDPTIIQVDAVGEVRGTCDKVKEICASSILLIEHLETIVARLDKTVSPGIAATSRAAEELRDALQSIVHACNDPAFDSALGPAEGYEFMARRLLPEPLVIPLAPMALLPSAITGPSETQGGLPTSGP